MAIDPQEYRNALGCFVTGVTVVTTLKPDGERIGLTVNSFNSVSIDPPLILFSLARQALSLPHFRDTDHFAVNVLQEGQLHLSNNFARSSTEKWDDVTVHVGETGCPLLPGCAAIFECRKYAEYDGGDHVIFVGEVLSMEADHGADPLVYHRGQYSAVATEA